MVSTVTESFFHEHFASLGHDRLQSCHWLQLRAANALAIPYIGYLELDITLCGKNIPRCGILVVKDPAGAEPSVPGILGMNVIHRCYQQLFGSHGRSFFDLPAVTQSPGPVIEALQHCHQATVQRHVPCTGAVRVRGPRVVQIPGGVMKLVASTCPEQLFGQSLLFEPPESGLPAGLLAFPCLVQVVRGTTYIPVVNVGTTKVLLYPRTCLGALSPAEVVSLPPGVTEVSSSTTVSAQAAVHPGQSGVDSVDLSALAKAEQVQVWSLLQWFSSSLLMRVTSAVPTCSHMTSPYWTTFQFGRGTDASHPPSMRPLKPTSINSWRLRL